ncbi:MAG TPA: hypothetical protein PKD90_00855 [Phnomibacter sp.]|nr:hypothetical protein [Phnomibacter sp.]
MDKFQNKYRIPSARFQQWDYRWAGAYFITICTQNREHYFGEIAKGQMQLSHIGVIADILWYQIPYHAQNIELGAFVVMPNHVHGILIITNHNNENDNDHDRGHGHGHGHVETGHALSLPSPPSPPSESVAKTIGQQRFQNIGKNSLSSIIGSYKSAVSKNAHRLGFDFQWQSRFHDHIIRNDEAFQNISKYIINNPGNWKEDRFFKANK